MERYNKGLEGGYQPYWILFCIKNDIPFDTLNRGSDFIVWINNKHREFEHIIDNRHELKYSEKFIFWLKEDIGVDNER